MFKQFVSLFVTKLCVLFKLHFTVVDDYIINHTTWTSNSTCVRLMHGYFSTFCSSQKRFQ